MSTNKRPLQQLKDLTILYVEDDNDTRKQFTDYLKRIANRVIAAENGLAGLDAFNEHSPHIVITDIQMPSMDGLTMAKEIRKKNSSVPIILLTAFHNTEYLMNAIEMSIDRFVEKPVQSSKLLQSLQHCADRVLAEKAMDKRQQEMIDKLFSAQRMESVGRLTSSIAHDFNNKLTVISGFAELGLMFSGNHDRTFEYLVEITHAAKSAKMLTEHLMMISRKQHSPSVEVDVNAVISMTGRSLSLLNGKVNFNLILDTDVHKVIMDPIQLDRIFMNLASNALDAMPHGGTLTVTTANITFEDCSPEHLFSNYVCLCICDDGEGMDEYTKAHIFDRLFTTKKEGKGTGLGLYTVHEIVTENGGFITVESRKGFGSKFSIYLPVATKASAESEQSDRPIFPINTDVVD